MEVIASLDRIVIFGARGDLARRYLLPGLAELVAAERIPAGFRVVAVDRDEMGDAAYRELVAGWLDEHATGTPKPARDVLVRMVEHRTADVTVPADVRAAVAPDQGPVAVYLALPPVVFGPALEALIEASLPDGSRIAVEKPFGTSLEHARELNALLRRCLPEHAVYRVDHFLGMQTVQNLVGMRFANRVLEPVWNAEHVEQVDIVWEETLSLEGRGYYDAVGALRDLVQNHLLQLLALVAMEPPARFAAGDLGDRKTDLLRAVRRLSAEEVEAHTIRGRYGAGQVGDHSVPAYADEPLVEPRRCTETFAEVRLEVDNWRWAGVPFVLRTGKALAADRREIVVRFRPVPLRRLAGAAAPNVLRIPLDPEAMTLELNLNVPGEEFGFRQVQLEHRLAPSALPAYARVLLAVLAGDPALSIRGDEAEESWEIVEPILRAWGDGRPPLHTYPAGSQGPSVEAGTAGARA